MNEGDVLNLRYLPTRLLNIEALADASTRSVSFRLDTTVSRTESSTPFALYSDDHGDFAGKTPSLGDHTLSATPYSQPAAKGSSGPTKTVHFTVVDRPITALALYDAGTGQPIAGYKNVRTGTAIDLAKLPTRDVTIRATADTRAVAKVEFGLDGLPVRTEYLAPYALFGDDGRGDLFGGPLAVGTHTLTARPAATGDATTFDAALSATFTVTDSAATAPTVVPANFWASTFNVAGTLPQFSVAGGSLVASSASTTITVNGRPLASTEYLLTAGTVKLLTPLVDGLTQIDLAALSTTGARVSACFAVWSGASNGPSLTAAGATGGARLVAQPGDGKPFAISEEVFVPAGGAAVLRNAPRQWLTVRGQSGDAATPLALSFAGSTLSADVRPAPVPLPPGQYPPLEIYTSLGRDMLRSDETVPGLTPVDTDMGAGRLFGTWVGPEWYVGGWAGPHTAADPALVQEYMAKVAPGTIYLGDGFENGYPTFTDQIAIELKGAYDRGLVVGYFDLPSYRPWGVTVDAWRAKNDAAMGALGRYLHWITPGLYFSDTTPSMPDDQRAGFNELLDEGLRVQTTQAIVPVISPYTHGGEPVPISKTLELIGLLRAHGINRVTVWTDQGLTSHVQATIDALKAA